MISANRSSSQSASLGLRGPTCLLLLVIIAAFLCPAPATAVEVHFETPDSGFFLKHSPRPSLMPSGGHPSSMSPSASDQAPTKVTALASGSGVGSGSGGEQSSILSVDRFTIVQTSQPVSIRASYGPFSTKQTVPAKFIVPDAALEQQQQLQQQQQQLQKQQLQLQLQQQSQSQQLKPQHLNTSQALLDLQQTNMHLDISAHLVRTSIPRDSPVLRVLFHAGADPGGHMQRQKICVLLHATLDARDPPLKGRCMPDGEDGVCVAEVTLPARWWPALQSPFAASGRPAHKVPQRMVQVAYSVFEPPGKNPELCEPKVQIQPLTQLAQVPLVAATGSYDVVPNSHGQPVFVYLPRSPLYLRSKFHASVFVRASEVKNVAVFIARARVKSGLRILGAAAVSDQWNISIEKENAKHTVARVTAFRKDQDPDSTGRSGEDDDNRYDVEVFAWLLESTSDHKITNDTGKVTWTISVVHDIAKVRSNNNNSMMQDQHQHAAIAAAFANSAGASASAGSSGSPSSASALNSKDARKHEYQFEYVKDDNQTVLPIAKNWDLMNTAVLTGRQVSQAMKVFIVSQGGTVSDVTLQCSCAAEDESVIKVSSSCSSVYVDGSEVRGSANAAIAVRYGEYTGFARFIVWMPETPLEVAVADFRLSQIKGWKIPDDHYGHSGKKQQLLHHRRRKRSYNWNKHNEAHSDLVNGLPERTTCRTRYQQSSVEVYARFLAVDQDSGRTSYLISRRTGLRVTDLVQPLLRVADPKIASLRGRILQGRAMGRTDVQVLSPITGRVIGAKEVRVGSDRVSISRLVVRVVSGLQLNITPDAAVENGYMAETSVTRKLTAQYQEGLLDMDLEFSDGTRTPLRDISVDDYFLLVESLDPEVVAFAPMLASHHPRVIAVGEGSGDLLRVTLLLSEECRTRRNIPLLKQATKSSPGPLATALAAVQVDFNTFETAAAAAAGGGGGGGPGAGSSGGGKSAGADGGVQNDGFLSRDRSRGRDGDLGDILIGLPVNKQQHHQQLGGFRGYAADGGSDEPTVQARQYRGGQQTSGGGGGSSGGVAVHMPPGGRHPYGQSLEASSTLEIGMYVLMAAFCLAIVVFVASCFVYASKFRPLGAEEAAAAAAAGRVDGVGGGLALGLDGQSALAAAGKRMREPRRKRESTQNAHDWVWLGRSTMDRASMVAVETGAGRNGAAAAAAAAAEAHRDSRIRITNNPNYTFPDETLQEVTCFDNPNHILMPTVGQHPIAAAAAAAVAPGTAAGGPVSSFDSSTYNKRERPRSTMAESPPPLPPHGVGLNSKPEYRPPVPPHRNVGVTANALPLPPRQNQPPPTSQHHHHHHHHHKSSRTAQQQQPPPHEIVAHHQPPASTRATNKLPPPPPPPPSHNQLATGCSSPPHPLQQHQPHHLAQTTAFLGAAQLHGRSHSPISQVLASASDLLAGAGGRCADRRSFRYSSGSSVDVGAAASQAQATAAAAANELHQAELLVDAAAHQQRSAFQFDTLTPVRSWYTPPAAPAGAIELNSNSSGGGASARNSFTEAQAAAAVDAAEQVRQVVLRKSPAARKPLLPVAGGAGDSSEEPESSDNGGFVTQSSSHSSDDSTDEGAQLRRARRAKRATVVGNPMFEAAAAAALRGEQQDGEDGDVDVEEEEEAAALSADDVPAESLGLDDLDMDYEQIMHYFDNLKESNA